MCPLKASLSVDLYDKNGADKNYGESWTLRKPWEA